MNGVLACVVTGDYLLASLCLCVLNRMGCTSEHVHVTHQASGHHLYDVIIHEPNASQHQIHHDWQQAKSWIGVMRTPCPDQRWGMISRGYHDYVVCPFSGEELERKVFHLLAGAPKLQSINRIGFWLFDRNRLLLQNEVTDEVFSLSAMENCVLSKLVDFQAVCSPMQLRNALIEDGFSCSPNSVSFLINRLRQRIEQHPSDPKHLITVKGVGYLLVT